MVSAIIYRSGSSALSWVVGIRPNDIVDYGKESVSYAVWSLVALPPDPFPLFVLLAAIFSSVMAISKFAQGKGLRMREWVLVVGTWGGHHAMMENRVRKALKKTVELLAEKLDKTEKQLARWEKIMEEEDGKVEKMQDAAGMLSGTSLELQKALEVFKQEIAVQKELCRDYLKLALMMDEGRIKAEHVLDDQKINLEKMSEYVAGQIQELKKIREGLLALNGEQKKFELAIRDKFKKTFGEQEGETCVE